MTKFGLSACRPAASNASCLSVASTHRFGVARGEALACAVTKDFSTTATCKRASHLNAFEGVDNA